MFNRTSVLASLLVLVLALAAAGCKKPPVTPDAPPEPVATNTPAEPPPAPETTTEITQDFPREVPETSTAPALSLEELERQGVLAVVYFGYDSYELDAAARAALLQNAEWLRGNPQHSIRVEGHCDERGTIEYNLALGERRASAVRDYLVSLGVEASKIRIVSYGEEEPAMPGHDESAWSKNRRAEFRFES